MRFAPLGFVLCLVVAVLASEDSTQNTQQALPTFEQLKKLVPSAFFVETFDDPSWSSRWIPSEAVKIVDGDEKLQFDGPWEVRLPKVVASYKNTNGLVISVPNKHYAISAKLDRPFTFDHMTDEKDEFVIQYEVKHEDSVACGGSYIKLLTASEDFSPASFNDKTPYTIMFGPDKCGTTNKVHFIIRHQNPITKEFEEKHWSPSMPHLETRQTTLYCLVIRGNNTFSILLNGKEVRSGNLLENFSPPFVPPKEIPDPADVKPADWVDEAEIPDETAVKPDDWDEDAPKTILDETAQKPSDWLDDEPLYITDPSAHKPEEWSDEDDGEWTAPIIPNPKCDEVSGCGEWKRPIIPNPAYKGKWKRPMLPNPDYKGPWVPRNISNPNYFDVPYPARLSPIGAVGFELWTITENIVFDNILLTSSLEEAQQFAQATFAIKKEEENILDPANKPKDSDPFYKQAFDVAVKEVDAFVKALQKDPVEAIKKHPIVAGVMVAVPFLGILFALICSPSRPPPPTVVRRPQQPQVAEEHKEEPRQEQTTEEEHKQIETEATQEASNTEDAKSDSQETVSSSQHMDTDTPSSPKDKKKKKTRKAE